MLPSPSKAVQEMEIIKSRKSISLAEVANTFIPFGILIITALIAAELTQNLNLYRTIYSFWATTVLLTPAICLYVLPKESEKKDSYWLLLWTFSFFAYLVHFCYSVFIVNGGIEETFRAQGTAIATSNFILTLWWGLDVCLAWFSNSEATWIKVQRIGAHIYIGLSFLIATLVLKGGFARTLGIIMTISILVCLLVRVRKPQKTV